MVSAQLVDERRAAPTLRSHGKVFLPLGLVWLIGLGVLALAAQSDDPQRLFFDRSFTGATGAWYVGVISQFGILAWSVAVLSAAWSSWFARHVGRRGAARFLGLGSLAGAVLLFDDLLDLHAVLPYSLGVPKLVLQVAVIAPAGLWFLQCFADIRRTRWPVLAAAIGGLSGSVLVEQLTGNSFSASATLLEDGAKFLGILAWATYFALTAVDIARSVLRETHDRRVAPPSVSPASSEASVDALV